MTGPVTVPHAGIFWTEKPENPGVVERIGHGRAWVVLSEAQLKAAPDTPARLLPCRTVASVNGWACFDNSESWNYWPTHRRIAEAAAISNGWLNDSHGQPIRTGAKLRLLDMRSLPVRQAWIESTIEILSTYGARTLFVDELYSRAYVESRTGRDADGWDQAMRHALRSVLATATGGIVVNASDDVEGLPSISGFYRQRFSGLTPQAAREWLKRRSAETPESKRRICVEIDPAQSAFWQGIVAPFPGVAVMEYFGDYRVRPPVLTLSDVSIDVDMDSRTARVAGGKG